MIRERTCLQCVSANIVSAASSRNFKLLNQHVQSWRTGVQQVLIGRSVCKLLVGSNSTPSLGWDEERNFIQCKQLGCDTAQLWSSTAVRRPLGEAAVGPAPLVWQLHCALVKHVSVSASAEEKQSFCLQWKGKVCFQSQRGADVYGQKSPLLVPDWSDLMQMRTPNPFSPGSPDGSEWSNSDWLMKVLMGL